MHGVLWNNPHWIEEGYRGGFLEEEQENMSWMKGWTGRSNQERSRGGISGKGTFQGGGSERWQGQAATKREEPESQMLGSKMDDGALQQTLHKAPGMSGSRWVITPSWLSWSWRSLSYSSSVYSCHLFLISSVSVRSIPFLSFIEPIFAWNVPLVSLIFMKRSLVFPILLFSSISLHWSLRKAFFSLLASLWNQTSCNVKSSGP